jgi:hypothetical protein
MGEKCFIFGSSKRECKIQYPGVLLSSSFNMQVMVRWLWSIGGVLVLSSTGKIGRKNLNK